MTRFIFITGRKGSGKDTLANYILERVTRDVLHTNIPKPAEVLAFADPLKAMCKALFLLTDDQLYDREQKEMIDERWGVTPRRMFQLEGDLQRDFLPMFLPELKLPDGLIFTQNMSWRIKALLERDIPPRLIIISDGRLEDEHTFIKSFPESVSIRLLRDTGKPIDNHSSEDGKFEVDLTWDNNTSVEELWKKADIILKELGLLSS